MKGKTHDLKHALTFSTHTINCVCRSIRSMFRVLGIYNFGSRFTDLWFLTDSWSQEAKWTEGRVKIDIKDSHVEDFQYKVS